MGNKLGAGSVFQEKNWRKISEIDSKTILFNEFTRKSVEKHTLTIENAEQDPAKIYKWRENLSPETCVAELYQYGIKNNNFCNPSSEVYVVTQHLHTFKQIITISKAQAFILIRDVSMAMSYLIQRFGFFSVTPDLIGVNVQGRGRVWIHENSACIFPVKDELLKEDSELVLVNNLIRIIKSKAFNQQDFSVEYPFNLDLKSVVLYIDKVFDSMGKYKVDKIYLDRSEYYKETKRLKNRLENEQQSRLFFQENQKKLLQLQNLHQNLKKQQQELLERQRAIQMAIKSGMSLQDQPTRIQAGQNFAKFSHPNQHQNNALENRISEPIQPQVNQHSSQYYRHPENRQHQNPQQIPYHNSINNYHQVSNGYQQYSSQNNAFQNMPNNYQEPITMINQQISSKQHFTPRMSNPGNIDPRPQYSPVHSSSLQLPSNNIEIVDSMVVIGEYNIAERNRSIEAQPISLFSHQQRN